MNIKKQEPEKDTNTISPDSKEENDKEGFVGIKKFDIRKDFITDRDFYILCAGKSHSGKGIFCHWLLIELIRNLKIKFKAVYLFSSSALLQPDSFSCVKKPYRLDFFDVELVGKIINKQEELFIKGYKEGKSKDQIKKENRILFIIDDLSFGNWSAEKSGMKATGVKMNSSVCERISTVGRHIAISCIHLTQTISMTISPKVRKNASMLIFFSCLSSKVMDLITSEFGLKNMYSNKECKEIITTIFKSKPFISLMVLQHMVGCSSYEDILRHFVVPKQLLPHMEKLLPKLQMTFDKVDKNSIIVPETEDEGENDMYATLKKSESHGRCFHI